MTTYESYSNCHFEYLAYYKRWQLIDASVFGSIRRAHAISQSLWVLPLLVGRLIQDYEAEYLTKIVMSL